ncbi:MAG: hypothetical protein HXY28_09755 [Hydrogenophilaceae bacterium]|jgi:hypothetical protein|nr:hypothetical protein [Hydrogenophilaceae bacterium]
MSKWSSARSRLCAALLIATLGLAACSDRSKAGASASDRRSATVTEVDLDVEPVSQEEPGLVRSRWETANAGAREVTGNLTVSLEEGRGGPLALAFANGVTLRAEELAVHEAGARVGAAADTTFRTVLGVPAEVRARVYRVIDERTSASAAAGGLCGREARTTAIAAAEFVDEGGDWALRIAAFKGRRPPGERGAEPEICGVFAFRQPG